MGPIPNNVRDRSMTPAPLAGGQPTAAYQRWVVVLLSLNIGIVFFDRYALNFLMPFVQPDLHLNNTQVGAFTSALSLSWALSCLLIGRVSDAWGRRKPLLVSCTVVFACMSFLSGMAGSFVTLLLTRLLTWIGRGSRGRLSGGTPNVDSGRARHETYKEKAECESGAPTAAALASTDRALVRKVAVGQR